MVYQQEVDSGEQGFYPGIQIEELPANSFILSNGHDPLQSNIEAETITIVKVNDDPLQYQGPIGIDIIEGLTINGVFTQDLTVDKETGIITVHGFSC